MMHFLQAIARISTFKAATRKKHSREIVPKFCSEAGFSGYYTNHSCKVTLATVMYKGGFDEQLIQERTGHRSLAVRQYKCTSTEQVKKSVSSLSHKSSDPGLMIPALMILAMMMMAPIITALGSPNNLKRISPNLLRALFLHLHSRIVFNFNVKF